ncbi:MAG: DUF975 family protein [Clostridia bacterium]|nr:DUF975 family protein [Clostridia bacterium]
MFTCSEIRRRARVTLGNNIFSKEWLFALLVSLVIEGILGASATFVLLPLILVGPLSYGMNRYYLNLTRRQGAPDSIDPALEGFKNNFTENLLTGLLSSIFTFLWSLLFVIPGIVKGLSYSMALYIRIDHPELTAQQAIAASTRLMDGYKMKLFLLYLSFIGWIIVGGLCFGIGTLWVNAYMQAAMAEFYEEIKAEKEGYARPAV